MQKQDIDIFAKSLTIGFKNYPLYEYVNSWQYNIDKMHLFYEISLKMIIESGLCYASTPAAESVLVYLPPHYKEPRLLDYIRSGGIKMIFQLGFKRVYRLLRFGNTVNRLKKRHLTENCGYLFMFATIPEARGKGHGGKLLNSLLEHLDSIDEDCYLETLKIENVALYNHFGFELVEHTKCPNEGFDIFAMLRKATKKPQNNVL